MKYEVGDRVKIKANLADGTEYGGYHFADSMLEYRGKVAMITEKNDRCGWYDLDIDSGDYAWTDDMLEPIAIEIPTFDEIHSKKLNCVILTKTIEEAERLDDRLPSNLSRSSKEYWDRYISGTAFSVVNGIISGYANDEFYLKNKATYGELYEFREIESNSIVKPTYPKDFLALADAWAKLGHTIPKEDSTMKNTFITVDSQRLDKTCNQQIPTKHTMAWGCDGTCAVAVCDKSEYDAHTGALVAAAKIIAQKTEETMLMYNLAMNMWGTDTCTAILKTLADRAMGGSFENVYKKWQRQIEQEEKLKAKKAITCSICGRWCNVGEDGTKYPFTPAEREEHEKWHEANRKAKRIRYQEHSEAKKRLAEMEREDRIAEYMKEIVLDKQK